MCVCARVCCMKRTIVYSLRIKSDKLVFKSLFSLRRSDFFVTSMHLPDRAPLSLKTRHATHKHHLIYLPQDDHASPAREPEGKQSIHYVCYWDHIFSLIRRRSVGRWNESTSLCLLTVKFGEPYGSRNHPPPSKFTHPLRILSRSEILNYYHLTLHPVQAEVMFFPNRLKEANCSCMIPTRKIIWPHLPGGTWKTKDEGTDSTLKMHLQVSLLDDLM